MSADRGLMKRAIVGLLDAIAAEPTPAQAPRQQGSNAMC